MRTSPVPVDEDAVVRPTRRGRRAGRWSSRMPRDPEHQRTIRWPWEPRDPKRQRTICWPWEGQPYPDPADNVYYVRSHVMSSQDGAEDGGALAAGSPPGYPEAPGSFRDSERVSEDERGDPSGQRVVPLAVPMGASMAETDASVGVAGLLDRFYSDLLNELGLFGLRRTATALGAAVVVKRVARAHGIAGAAPSPPPPLAGWRSWKTAASRIGSNRNECAGRCARIGPGPGARGLAAASAGCPGSERRMRSGRRGVCVPSRGGL